jgi:hypothetical protein
MTASPEATAVLPSVLPNSGRTVSPEEQEAMNRDWGGDRPGETPGSGMTRFPDTIEDKTDEEESA